MKYKNKFICIDALEGLRNLPDNSIDLCLTSPPYSDVRKSYFGPSPFDYVKWFTPMAKELHRTLSKNGSFILNINDKCVKGERIPYCFELVLKLRDLNFVFIDTQIWIKKNGVAGAGRRPADYFEYIFHFCKSTKPIFNKDEIRTPYAASSVKRAKTPIKNNVSNRESRGTSTKYKTWVLHPKGAAPKNLLYFKKDSGKNHVAAFHIDLPLHYIKAYSNPGDMVLDPFAGRGTTLQAAKQLKRDFVGFDIKQEHIDLGKKLYNLKSV